MPIPLGIEQEHPNNQNSEMTFWEFFEFLVRVAKIKNSGSKVRLACAATCAMSESALRLLDITSGSKGLEKLKYDFHVNTGPDRQCSARLA
jgi:hypothetical protein